MGKIRVGLIIILVLFISSFIISSSVIPENWFLFRLKNDSNVVSTIIEIDNKTIEIIIDKITNLSGNYKWDMALCNLTYLPNVSYYNEDNRGGFNFSTAISLNYNKLTNYGMNSTWCSENNNYGYVLFSGGSRNQLPKRFRIEFPLKTAFRLYFGSGSEESIISSDDPTEDVLLTMCADNQTYYWNESIETSWMVLGNPNQSATINGSWYETLMTYDTHPKCTSFNPYTINMTCLTQSCSSIVQLNKLTGNVTTIWQAGEVW